MTKDEIKDKISMALKDPIKAASFLPSSRKR